MIDFLTVKEVGEKWNVSGRMVTIYCKDGRIEGAIKKGNLWLVPIDAKNLRTGARVVLKKLRIKLTIHVIYKLN